MSGIATKPTSNRPLLDFDDGINKGQIAWWFGGEGAGSVLQNIANPALYKGALQSGVTWSSDLYGRMPTGDGSSTSYVDCGTSALISDTNPFTLMWLETVAPSPPTGILGVLCLFPSGATQRFLVTRSDSNATYGPISIGKGTATNVPRWAAAPSIASGIGITRVWLLSGDSLNSNSGASFALSVDGVNLGVGAAGSGNNFGAQTANLNYLGWDGSDTKFKGGIHNVRLWNRRLGLQEVNRLMANPFAGVAKRRHRFSAAPVAVRGNMLLAM